MCDHLNGKRLAYFAYNFFIFFYFLLHTSLSLAPFFISYYHRCSYITEKLRIQLMSSCQMQKERKVNLRARRGRVRTPSVGRVGRKLWHCVCSPLITGKLPVGNSGMSRGKKDERVYYTHTGEDQLCELITVKTPQKACKLLSCFCLSCLAKKIYMCTYALFCSHLHTVPVVL